MFTNPRKRKQTKIWFFATWLVWFCFAWFIRGRENTSSHFSILALILKLHCQGWKVSYGWMQHAETQNGKMGFLDLAWLPDILEYPGVLDSDRKWKVLIRFRAFKSHPCFYGFWLRAFTFSWIKFFLIFSVIDCQVSEWSSWSKCNVACGTGTSIRTREVRWDYFHYGYCHCNDLGWFFPHLPQVLRPESNGGVQCPPLEEKKTCKASKCSKNRLDKISALRGEQKE